MVNKIRGPFMLEKVRLIALVITCSALAACASVDFDYPKEDTRAYTDTDDTEFGKIATGLVAAHPPGESGFYPMSDAIDALATRLLMAEQAERSIDAQYYLIKPDVVGNVFIEVLLRAADRGVRVRLLLDDILTKGYDAGMAALDSHPNFEIRIFNPFANRSARGLGFVTDFSRVNRRMHNKSFTVDNSVTIIGGRNIAGEYFGAREDAKFGDLDVIGVGQVVQDVSNMFDDYWNHSAAAPLPAFAKMTEDPEGDLVVLRERLIESRESIKDTPYAEAVRRQVGHYLATEESVLMWAPYTLAVDSPDKSNKNLAKDAASITTELKQTILTSRKEVLIISPYFVPRKAGVEVFTTLQKSGVDITIVTNSLAANNQKTVHGGYAPSRKPLLEAGVKIFEVRPDAGISGSEYVAGKAARATLHTKAFIVDRHDVFIGSFNFDPRSANINTELGVIIHSDAIAESMLSGMDQKIKDNAYEVFLNEKGKVRWREFNGEEVTIHDKEPNTSWWNRFVAGFYRIMPIDSQL
jgi:putative cardiolipin synthase